MVPPVEIRPVAAVHGEVGHGLAVLQHVLAAREVVDEGAGVGMPCHILVDMAPREILGARNPEARRRARERVPHEMVCAVGESVVCAFLQRGGIH